ncbi:hypothetical protein [Undibacterium luofuense]|uniref:hypothetical protein n=1 Tax=Undibacterium luofuense TaxID=2828733 RepID=UPI0030EE9A2E
MGETGMPKSLFPINGLSFSIALVGKMKRDEGVLRSAFPNKVIKDGASSGLIDLTVFLGFFWTFYILNVGAKRLNAS